MSITATPTRTHQPATTTAASSSEPGAMWLDHAFQTELIGAGLGGFRAVMSTSDGRCMRVLKDRENWRIEIPDSQGQPRGFYLKRHHVRTWAGRLRAWLGLGPGETAARVEAENARRLADDGIDVMRVAAFGEQLRADGTVESFLLTEELDGHVQLDHFLVGRFPPRELFETTARSADLDSLIRGAADLARRFHAAGYNHRDLYCCHFFIHEPSPGRFEIKLIDLQRVQRRRRFRRRWLVKDLAQLAYSAPRDRIKCTQKMAFIRRYLGVRKLRPKDKRLIREILAKQQFLERKQGLIA